MVLSEFRNAMQSLRVNAACKCEYFDVNPKIIDPNDVYLKCVYLLKPAFLGVLSKQTCPDWVGGGRVGVTELESNLSTLFFTPSPNSVHCLRQKLNCTSFLFKIFALNAVL